MRKRIARTSTGFDVLEGQYRQQFDSSFAPSIKLGKQIANGSHFPTNKKASLNGDRIPTVVVNLLPNTSPLE